GWSPSRTRGPRHGRRSRDLRPRGKPGQLLERPIEPLGDDLLRQAEVRCDRLPIKLVLHAREQHLALLLAQTGLLGGDVAGIEAKVGDLVSLEAQDVDVRPTLDLDAASKATAGHVDQRDDLLSRIEQLDRLGPELPPGLAELTHPALDVIAIVVRAGL